MPNKLIIFCGPRGVGKGTLVEWIECKCGIRRITSCTTRSRRRGEIDHEHYHFLLEEDFYQRYKNDTMFWRFPVGNWRYGLERAEIARTDYDVGVTDVYPDGARLLRDHVRSRGGDALLLAVFAPEQERLRRIINRGSSPEEARKLMEEDPAPKSSWRYFDFDHWIDNSSLGDLRPAKSAALEAVQKFLNGSQT